MIEDVMEAEEQVGEVVADKVVDVEEVFCPVAK